MSVISGVSGASAETGSSGVFNFYEPIHAIVRRLLLHDMCRPWTNVKKQDTLQELLRFIMMDIAREADILAEGTIGEDGIGRDDYHPAQFVAAILEDLLETINERPTLPNVPTFEWSSFGSSESARSAALLNFLRNFGVLVDKLTSQLALLESVRFDASRSLGMPRGLRYSNVPDLISRSVSVIKKVAAKNDTAVRAKIEEASLLKLRDKLLMRCLSPFHMRFAPLYARVESMLSFEVLLETVAQGKSFNSNNGALHLVSLFVTTLREGDDSAMADSVMVLMSTAARVSEDCRRHFARVIEDKSFLIRLGLSADEIKRFSGKSQQSSSKWSLSSWRGASASEDAGAESSEASEGQAEAAEDGETSSGNADGIGDGDRDRDRDDAGNTYRILSEETLIAIDAKLMKLLASDEKAAEAALRKQSRSIFKQAKSTFEKEAKLSASLRKQMQEKRRFCQKRCTAAAEKLLPLFLRQIEERQRVMEVGGIWWKEVSKSLHIETRHAEDPWDACCREYLDDDEGGFR